MADSRITKRSVEALTCPPGRDRVFLWDGSLSGFGVAAMASGKRVYVAQFRQHGHSRRMKLGEHGRITPDQARSLAKEVLGAVEGGKDPIEERKAKSAVRTFREVAGDYLRQHVATKRKKRTYGEYDTLLRLHILPAIGARPITRIAKAEIARLHGGMTDRPAAANRCLSLFDAIWNWAVRTGEVPQAPSPSRGLDRNPERSRERYLTPPELRRLGAALREAETVGLPWNVNENGPKAKHLAKVENRIQLIDAPAVAAIRLLMLTGARLREILEARWDYVDFERGMMFLPDSKTGRKTIYLSAAALAVLDDIERVPGNPYIIPGKAAGHRSDLKRPWDAIVRAAGLVEPEGSRKGAIANERKRRKTMRPSLRLHDLRHTFAAMGAGSSLGLPVIGKLLGHSQPRTTQRYAHLDADPLHKAANLIGDQIAAAIGAPAMMALPAPKENADA